MFIERKRHAACAVLLGVLCAGGFETETAVSGRGHRKTSGTRDGARDTTARPAARPGVAAARAEEGQAGPGRHTPCHYSEEATGKPVRELNIPHSIEGPVLAYRVEPDPRRHAVVGARGRAPRSKSLILDCAPGGVAGEMPYPTPEAGRRQRGG